MIIRAAGPSLLQSDLLHQAREIGVFLGDQLAELGGRQEGGPHAEGLAAAGELGRSPRCGGSPPRAPRSPGAACRAARRCRARLRAHTSTPCSRAVGTSGSAGSRFGISAASRRTDPCFTWPISAAGSCTTASTCPPTRLGTTCAAPNGISLTLTPAALDERHQRDVRVAADARVADADLLGPRVASAIELAQRLPARVGAHRDAPATRPARAPRRRTRGSRTSSWPEW